MNVFTLRMVKVLSYSRQQALPRKFAYFAKTSACTALLILISVLNIIEKILFIQCLNQEVFKYYGLPY
jgi:hypothetical protein